MGIKKTDNFLILQKSNLRKDATVTEIVSLFATYK